VTATADTKIWGSIRDPYQSNHFQEDHRHHEPRLCTGLHHQGIPAL